MDIVNSKFKKYTSSETWNKFKRYSTVSEMLDAVVPQYKNNVAFVDGEKYTFEQLDKLVGSVRQTLKNKNVKKGDKVGILFENSIESVVTSLAVMSYGAVAVMLPYQLNNEMLFGCSKLYTLSTLLTLRKDEERLQLIDKNQVDVIYYDELEKTGYLPAETLDTEDDCVILFTGGTTGRSKGALLTHKNVMTGVFNGLFGYHDVFEQKYFLVLPLTHVFGFIRNQLTSIATGSCLYICRNLKNMFKEMMVFKPTCLVMVPALAEMALNVSKMMKVNALGSDVKYIICGAAVVPPYLVKEYKKFNVKLLPGYGLTESANLVSGNPESAVNAESVGYFYGAQSYKIVDGELWIKGDNIFKCYYNNPEETKNAFEDGYFKTGDLVRVDDDGFLYIVGRIKDIIILSNGENVSPAELECKFNELECVQDSLVYEGKTENGSSELVLEIMPRMMFFKENNIADFKAYCLEKLKEVNAKLYSYQKITKFIIRDTDFERTPSMKIKRPR